MILIAVFGCDRATSYDVCLKGNMPQKEYALTRAEIIKSLEIIDEIAMCYKLTQATTIPRDIAHLKPLAVYRETDVGIVSGNVSLIIYTEKEEQSLVININGLGPNNCNRQVIKEIIDMLHAKLSSEFGVKRIFVNNTPEIIKVAG